MPGRAAGAEVEYVEVESACNCSSRWQRYASRWYVERAYRHGKEWDLRKTCWRGLVQAPYACLSFKHHAIVIVVGYALVVG